MGEVNNVMFIASDFYFYFQLLLVSALISLLAKYSVTPFDLNLMPFSAGMTMFRLWLKS